MRISVWSSDVCSSDIGAVVCIGAVHIALGALEIGEHRVPAPAGRAEFGPAIVIPCIAADVEHRVDRARSAHAAPARLIAARSEEHTSELQSLMRISYDVFCLK